MNLFGLIPSRAGIGRFLLLAAVLAALLLNVGRAGQFGVYGNAPIWVLNAVPAALTHMYVEDAPRYMLAKPVYDAYYVADWLPPSKRQDVNQAISRISKLSFDKENTEYLLLGNDDKGIVDFVEASFRILKPRIEAVAVLYYLLLAISAALFAWRYWRSPWAMASAACVLFAMYQFLPTVVFNPQLTSPLALRCMPLLSLIACLHCAFFACSPRKSVPDVVALACQAGLIVLVLHIRSTAIWQIVAIAGVTVLWLAVQFKSANIVRTRFAVSALPMAMLIAGYGALGLYRHLAFPAQYQKGEQILTRVVWHNVYSGFALHPGFAQRESLRIDDVSIIAAAGRFLKQEGKEALWKEVGGESPGYNRIKWSRFDEVVRDMFFATCRREPAMCAETFMFWKPVYFVDTLSWFYGFSGAKAPRIADAFVSNYFGDAGKRQIVDMGKELSKRGYSAAPWAGGFLLLCLLLLPGIWIAAAGTGLIETGCLAVLTAASTVPSFVGYPAPLGMVDSGVMCSALLQVLVLMCAAALRRTAARA